jgi:outer membrane receptor protein involved in Fe transport
MENRFNSPGAEIDLEGGDMKYLAVLFVVLTMLVGYGPPVVAQEAELTDEQLQQAIAQQGGAAFEKEITVTGTLIPRPSLDSLSPVTVVDVMEELTLTGTTRVEDLIVSLPQVFAGQNSTIANGANGIASIDLRHMGTVRTLVLVNGRRLAMGDQSASDINAIPSSLVKRVDVLTGGASTIYGSDAVAGVVNFVLDTDFTGVRGGVQYSIYQHDNNNTLAQELNEAAGYDYPSGTTWDGGAINANIAVGGRIADGRGHASAYIDYRKIDELVKSSRDYFNCTVFESEDGPYCGGSRTTPEGTFIAYYPDFSRNGEFMVGQREDGHDGHSFVPWDERRFNYGPYNHIQRPDEKWNAGGFAHYTINDHFEPYLEVMFMRDYTDAQIAPSGNFGVTNTINCDNPMLSEQQRNLICTQAGYGPEDSAWVVSFRRNVEGDARSNQIGHTNFRLVAGLRGDINDAWSYDLYGLHAESNAQFSFVNDLNVQRIQNALDVIVDPDTGEWVCRSGSDDGCVPWNIFEEGAVTQEALDYISATALMSTDHVTRVLNLTFAGDLESYGLRIPSASEGLQVALGAEYRSEFQHLRPDEVFLTGTAGQRSNIERLEADYDVKELFIEALVPIVQDTRGFRDLSLELGYRWSDYSTSGGVNTYKGLLNWAITDSWRIRGGYNRAIRAPNIWELFRPTSESMGGEDPCANDLDTGVPEATLEECLRTGMTEEQYGTVPSFFEVRTVWGGNQLLEPETADTITAGIVWTPTAVPGLSITADYYDIEVNETIGSLAAWFILNHCGKTGDPRFCGWIHRDEFGTLELSPDAHVDTRNQNIGFRKAEGVDLNANWLIGLGGAGYLNTSLIGTYLLTQEYADPSFDFDCVGYYGVVCGQNQATWRHRWRTAWESNFNMVLSLTWRRIGPGKIDDSSPDPDLGWPPNMPANIASGNDTVDAYDWFDLAASYTWRSGIQLTLGVNNIFDQEPPFLPGYADVNALGIYANYDPLGRHIFASLKFDF